MLFASYAIFVSDVTAGTKMEVFSRIERLKAVKIKLRD